MSRTTWLDELSLHCSESFCFLLDSLVIPPSSSSSLNQQNIQLLNQEKKKVEWTKSRQDLLKEVKQMWKILFLSTLSSPLQPACAPARCSIHLQTVRGGWFFFIYFQPPLLFCQWSSSPPSAQSRCTSRSHSQHTAGHTGESTWAINCWNLSDSSISRNFMDIYLRWSRKIVDFRFYCQTLNGQFLFYRSYFLDYRRWKASSVQNTNIETNLKTWHRAQHFSAILQTWSAPRDACAPSGRSPRWHTCRQPPSFLSLRFVQDWHSYIVNQCILLILSYFSSKTRSANKLCYGRKRTCSCSSEEGCSSSKPPPCPSTAGNSPGWNQTIKNLSRNCQNGT